MTYQVQESPAGDAEAAAQAAIQLVGLTKFYGRHRGVEDLSLDVRPGEILGLLGPNGAGKTTVIRLILGFLRPSAGHGTVLGNDIWSQSVAVRRNVGYLPGDPALYPNMDGRELLQFSLRVRGLDSAPLAERLIAELNVPMNREIRKCSRGMRQKVALVVTLAHDPDILILDEPTSGLDPLGQRALLTFLAERAAAGRIIVLSSHVLSEVEEVCDRVAILRDGLLVTLDTVDNLRRQKYREVTITFAAEPPSLEGAGELEVIWRHENRIVFRVRGDVTDLLRALAASDITDVRITEPSLEDVFLDYYRGEAAT